MKTPDPSQWLLPRKAEFKGPTPRVVGIGGDGVGPEVVDASVRCLEALSLPIEVRRPEKAEAELARETKLPDALKAEIDGADAVLFGAADTSSGHAVPVLRYLRFGLQAYANIRPSASLEAVPGLTGKGATNCVIVRELTEGMYPGREGDTAELKQRWPELHDRAGRALPDQGKFAVRVITPEASRRIARYAAELAAHRKQLGVGPGKVTIVDKGNVLKQTDGLFRSVCSEEIESVGGLEQDHVYVDEAARRMVACPESFDVVVTTNLFGDILSDVASEVMGGMPIVPSAGIGASSAYFEACHGSAPDIAGQDRANPAATILSTSMMLYYLGQPEGGQRLLDAVLSTIQSGRKTGDLGGDASCSAFTSAVCERLR